MHPQLRKPLLVVATAVVLLLCLVITLSDVDRDESLAFALGATLGRFAIALLVVLLVRLIARRMRDRPDFVSFPAAACAASVLALVLTLAVLENREREDERQLQAAVGATRSCVEDSGEPLERIHAPYELRALSAADQEAVDQTFTPSFREALEVRDLYRRSLLVGRVVRMAVDEDGAMQQDFVRGVRERIQDGGAAPRSAQLAGREVTIGELEGLTLIAGRIDCGAAMVSADSESAAEKVWTMLAAPA